MSNAVADATHGCDMSGNSAQGTCSCDGIGRAGVATAFGMPFAEALGNWPLVALNTVHATIKGWFTRLDVMLLDLPYGVGPVVSTMVREVVDAQHRRMDSVEWVCWIVAVVVIVLQQSSRCHVARRKRVADRCLSMMGAENLEMVSHPSRT